MYRHVFLTLIALSMSCNLGAQEFGTSVSIHDKGKETYYVEGFIAGLGSVDFLVDTGSSYMTINEDALEVLKAQNQVRYVKELIGILADGSSKQVSVYLIEQVTLGSQCILYDVEAAVLPAKTRYILGLSALKKASPFAIHTEPLPKLVLSHCGTQDLENKVKKTAEPEASAV